MLIRKEVQEQSSIASMVKQPPEVIYYRDTMTRVMQKFDQSHSWHLPVLASDNKFIGFISKSKLFNRYREILAENSDLYEEA